MSSHTTSNIFVIGGTGAQGIPIVPALVADKKYSVRVLSRDSASPRATDLLALDGVSILEGSFADEAVLREGFRGCDGAYINIDGFNTGEKTETYWAIRSYEIAIEEGIKFFVTETWTTPSRNQATTPISAPAIMTARAVWASGSCFRIRSTAIGWEQRSSLRVPTSRW